MPDDLESLDPLYRHVFTDARNGSPANISKAGCLALARLGPVSWNAWRKDFPSDGRKINHGYGVTSSYGNFADFRNHVFKSCVDFSNFNFGAHANFENAEFIQIAHFDRSTFGEDANFELAKFMEGATFQATKFENYVTFKCSQFNKLAFFSHAQFGGCATFIGVRFSGQTNFNNVIFGSQLIFDHAVFDCLVVSFMGGSWESLFSVYQSEKVEDIKLWAIQRGLHPGKINCASFGGAKFSGVVDFSGIEFVGCTRFSKSFRQGMTFWAERDNDGHPKPAGNGRVKKLASFKSELGIPLVFGSPPIFHNCKFDQDISFDGAEFPKATGFEGSVRAYRTLKLAFAHQQAVREEQQFFRLEMAEEAKGASWRQRYLYRAYWLLSDYGFSLWRPLALLLVSWLVFSSMYGAFANLTLCVPTQDGCRISRTWVEFSLLQALPLPGLDKLGDTLRGQLFVNNDASIGLIVATIFHKTFSLLALFLVGLALRNLFKMK